MLKELWNDAEGGFHPASAPDFLPQTTLRTLQLRRLRAVIAHAYANIQLFRERMDERGLTPASIQSLQDIRHLPFTVKTDLRDTYPFGLFASPLSDVVRLHASSGTTGKPIVVAYTREDVDVWSEVMVRTFAACGLHRGDILQNAFGYGLFTGGLGAHYGGEALGAAVIPVAAGNTRRQIEIMHDLGPEVLVCTPSYALTIHAHTHGLSRMSPEGSPLPHPSPGRSMKHPTVCSARHISFALAALLALLPPSIALAEEEGVFIETINRSSGLIGEAPTEEVSHTFVAYGKMKVASTDPQGTDMILDPATGDMTFMHHGSREFYRINAKHMMEGLSKPGLEQMRAMMEQTRVKVEPTDETREINGWNCRKYRVAKTGVMEIEQEIWATEDVDLDLERYTDLMRLSGPEGLLGDSEAARAQRAEMQKIKGYPILTTSRMQLMGTNMESETEVRVIRREPMAASLFEVPADYREREMNRPGAPSADGAPTGHP
ncbi:MAG: DUF4412 domain-containing protein [Thermochromatium sp.]